MIDSDDSTASPPSVPLSIQRDSVSLMIREHHALENMELRERVADLESERDSYRVLAQEAIAALHHVTEERDCARRALAMSRHLRRTAPITPQVQAAA